MITHNGEIAKISLNYHKTGNVPFCAIIVTGKRNFLKHSPRFSSDKMFFMEWSFQFNVPLTTRSWRWENVF